MGCGKSKHDVAAGNTITRKKSINVGEEQSKKENNKDTVETIAGTGQIDDKKTDSSSVVVQQKEEGKVRDPVSNNVIVEKDQNPSKVVEGKDDIGESKELIKEGNGEIISNESTAVEDAALREEEREAAVVSKGKSEDDTSAQESGKDGLVSEIVKVNEVKKEEDLVEETTGEESKNEGLTENLEKEIEAAADIEAKAEAEAASESKSEEKENTADPPSTEGKDS